MRSFRKPVLVLALLGVAVAAPALAQQSSQYPAPCDASRVSRADVERAHTLYLSGKQFLDESNYDKAISYFKDAYSIDCSVHGILPIIATAYERKGDKVEAIHALEEYLRRSPSAGDREVIERRIKNLKDQVAASGATPSTTAAPPPPSSTSAPTPPPSATAVTAPPPPSAAPEAPSATSSMGSAAPPPAEKGGHTVAPWVVVGVGAAAAVTGVVLFAVGASDVSSAANDCPSRTGCSQSVADKGNSGRTLETVGGIVGGVGVAAAVAGLIWHFAEPSRTTVGSTLSPTFGPGYGGLSVVGRF